MACGGTESPPRAEDAPSASTRTEPGPSGPRDLDGEPRDPLGANDRADALVFLRTDCPISNRYAPAIRRIATKFSDAPLDLWLVFVDVDETASVVRQHVSEYELPGTVLLDPDQALVQRTGVRVTPEVAIFTAQGQRAYRGRIDDWYADYGKPRASPTTAEFVEGVEAVLSGRAPAASETTAVGCPIPPLPGEPRR